MGWHLKGGGRCINFDGLRGLLAQSMVGSNQSGGSDGMVYLQKYESLHKGWGQSAKQGPARVGF